MPTKTWAPGEAVIAADFNSYVQQQVVATFANAAARAAAITTPLPGMLTWVADKARLEYYTGAGWRPTAPRPVASGSNPGSVSAGSDWVSVFRLSATLEFAARTRLYVSGHLNTEIQSLYVATTIRRDVGASFTDVAWPIWSNDVAMPGHQLSGASMAEENLAAGTHTWDFMGLAPGGIITFAPNLIQMALDVVSWT